MNGSFWLIRDKRQVKDRLATFQQFLEQTWDWSNPIAWKVTVYKDPRTVSQNALLHMWCEEMANQFAAGGADVDKESMKDLMKYRFLGTDDRVINNTVIPDQLRRTRDLDKGDMMFFLNQIQEWALDHGVKLTAPVNSEYMELRQRM